MENLSLIKSSRVYDIKGSTLNRKVLLNNVKFENQTLKDIDFEEIENSIIVNK